MKAFPRPHWQMSYSGAWGKSVRPPGQTVTVYAHPKCTLQLIRLFPLYGLSQNEHVKKKLYAELSFPIWLRLDKLSAEHHHPEGASVPLARMKTWHLASVLTTHGTIKMPQQGQSSKWSLNIGSCLISLSERVLLMAYSPPQVVEATEAFNAWWDLKDLIWSLSTFFHITEYL